MIILIDSEQEAAMHLKRSPTHTAIYIETHV